MRLRNKLQVFAFLSCALATGCAGGQGGDPGQSDRDAGGVGGGGTGGVGGFSGAAGQSGQGCATGAESFGIVSAALDEDQPVLSETVELLDTTTGERHIRAEGLVRLEGGLMTTGYNGFWAIELSEPPSKTRVAHEGPVHTALPADLDGDGDDDVLGLGTMRQRFADGGASYDAARGFVWEREDGKLAFVDSFELSRPVALGDVDEDGDLDIAGILWEGLGMLRNEGALHFTPIEGNPGLAACGDCQVIDIMLNDLDGDGALDLVALVERRSAGQEGIWIAVQRGDGAGGLDEPELSKVSDEAQIDGSKLTGDINGDSYGDFVLSRDGDERPETVVVLGAAGGFLPPQLLEYNIDDALDLDGDGLLDLITLEDGAVTVRYSRGVDLYDTHRYDLPLSAGTRVAMERPSAGSAPVIHALYRTGCRSACTSECGACVFGVCMECLNHDDCSSGYCQHGQCLVAPRDEDAGAD